MQGYHTGLPHLLFPSKQHIKHDKRVKQCLKLKTPAGRRAHSMRKNARQLGWANTIRKNARQLGWANTIRKNARRLGGPTLYAKTPAGRRANTLRKNARRQAGAPNSI